MAKIFLAPRSNKASYRHFQSTIEDGVEFDEIKHGLNPSVYASLENQPKICAWGNKESLRSRWEKMEKGDFVLFYREGAFVYCGRLLAKQENKEIAKKLWGPDENGEYWSCLFFLESMRPINISISVLRTLAGYKASWDRVQGFMPLNEEGLQQINDRYGSVEQFLDVDSSKLKDDALEEINVDLPFNHNPRPIVIKKIVAGKQAKTVFTRDEQKLGKANATHQRLVNFLAEYFKQKGLKPKEDRKSYDALVVIGKTKFLFEVKSVTSNNVNSQIRKAVSQLLHYEFFQILPLMKDDEKLEKCILLNSKPPKKIIDWLKYLGIKLFWVNRPIKYPNSKLHGPTELL